jgi:hypothetical protein
MRFFELGMSFYAWTADSTPSLNAQLPTPNDKALKLQRWALHVERWALNLAP